MGKDLSKGDRGSWRSHGGRAVGTVVRRLTSTTKVKGHTAKATPEKPQYLVAVDGGGKAAHKPSALQRLRGKDARKAEDAGSKGTKKAKAKAKRAKAASETAKREAKATITGKGKGKDTAKKKGRRKGRTKGAT